MPDESGILHGVRLDLRALAQLMVVAGLLAGVLACERTSLVDEAHGAALPAPAAAGPEVPTSAPSVEAAQVLPFGRSSELPEGRRFDWPGSGLRARFRGTALRIELDEHGHDDLTVWLDGAVHTAVLGLHPGKNSVLVSARSPAFGEEHVVEIGKRTEARDGYFVVKDVAAVDGVLLPLAARLRLEVIGDSISAGFGVWPSRADGGCSFASRENDAFSSYAGLFARERNLDLSLIAVSSKTTRQMTTFYQHAWPDKSAPLWAFGEAPSAVVVLLGTNDFFQRDPGRATFVHDTLALLGSVRAHYGVHVPVVMLLSPMLSDAYPAGSRHRTLGRSYLETALARARAQGETKLHSLELEPPTLAEGLGCRSHPSAATHRAMAAKLSQLFDQEHVVR